MGGIHTHMRSVLEITEYPDTLPMSLADMKTHLRVSHNTEDSYITSLMWVAYWWICEEANITLSETSYRLTLDCWNTKVVIPKPPLMSVDAVSYYDTSNSLQTLDSEDFYLMAPSKQQAYLLPVTSFPAVFDRPDAIQIDFTAGADSFNQELHLMRLLVGTMYENREAEVTGTITKKIELGVDRLLSQIKCWEYV